MLRNPIFYDEKNNLIYPVDFMLWAHALAQRFMVKSLDVTNGLSSDYVMQMAMDKYGFIWVATEEGLNRFDGSRFFSYYHVKDRNSITANELNCLLDDPQETKCG